MPMEFINQNILLISVVVTSGLAVLWPMLARSSANEVSPVQATLLINREEAQILDVREADEFANGHLPEAVNIPLARLGERVGELEKLKDKPLIVCCAAGVRSGKACKELKSLGFERLHSLAGGVDAWLAAGYPLKKGKRGK